MLLSLQRDLTNMEDKLQELDEKDDEHVRTRIFLWSQQEDRRRSETCEGKCPDQPTGNQDRTKRPDTRQALLRDIKEKLEEYGTFCGIRGSDRALQQLTTFIDKFLSQIQEISQLPLVNSGVREAMTKKLGHDNPFIKQEFDFLYHNNDLMTLTQDSMPRWVVDIIFWMLKHRPFNWIVSVSKSAFQFSSFGSLRLTFIEPIVETNDTRNMNDAPNIRYISDERTETLVYVISRFTVAILSACLVTGPVLIIIRFRQVINDMARTWTVFGFTMFFSFIIAFSTGKDLRFVFTAVAT